MPNNHILTQDGRWITVSDDELYHYGVLGMKWGVHRAVRKSSANARLKSKALGYDAKAAKLTKKAEKAHAANDLERGNRKAVKAAAYDKKAAALEKKAMKASNDVSRTILERKAATNKYKAAKARIEGNRLSKTTGYGAEAMKWSIKSDQVAKKAAKARVKIARNEAYIATMKRKASSLSKEQVQSGYSFVSKLSNID